MSTVIRPELSKKNEYFVEKERYYELKHFCKQYKRWEDIVSDQNIHYAGYWDSELAGGADKKAIYISKPTEREVELREKCLKNIKLLDVCAEAASNSTFAYYILLGVTQGLSYDTLKTKYDMPCSRDYYYSRYRKFFWILDAARD